MTKQKVTIARKSFPVVQLPLAPRQAIHISNIRIKPLKRHDEYQEVFDKLYERIKTHIQLEKDTITIITGDILDNKSNFRPETIQMVRTFLKTLAGLNPVLIIAGHHDIFDTDRMDAITPFVDIENLFYCKTSGIYDCQNDLCFVVSSLYDHKFITSEQARCSSAKKLVALYHGSLGEKGNKLADDFEGFDAVLLGSQQHHQALSLDSGPMAYSGSLLQQTHYDEPKHGYLLWDFHSTDKITFIHQEIPNKFGFVDIICTNGHWINRDIILPKNCYARLLITNCTELQVDTVIAHLRNITDTIVITQEHSNDGTIESSDLPASLDILREQDENILLTELASAKGFSNRIEELLYLHQGYQELEKSTRIMSNAVMRPLVMTFKNLFGYGNSRENVVTFSRGATCIVAGNAAGKTSIGNILTFGLFGRTSLGPTSRAAPFDIVNHDETQGYVTLLIKYGEKFYLIERRSGKMTKTTNNQFKNLNRYDFTCEIWESNIKSEKFAQCKESLLQEIVGDIDTFSMLNILNKESSMDILSLSGVEQLTHLKRIFKLEVFDKYKDLNKESLKKIKDNLLKMRGAFDALKSNDDLDILQKELHEITLVEDEDLLSQMRDNLSGLQVELEEKRENVQDLRQQIASSDHGYVEVTKSLEELQLLTAHVPPTRGYILSVLQAELQSIPCPSASINQDLIAKYHKQRNLPSLSEVQHEINRLEGQFKYIPTTGDQELNLDTVERELETFDYNNSKKTTKLQQINSLIEYSEYEYSDNIHDIIKELQQTKDDHRYVNTANLTLLNEEELAEIEYFGPIMKIPHPSGPRPEAATLKTLQHKLAKLDNVWSQQETIDIINSLPLHEEHYLMTIDQHDSLLMSLEIHEHERETLIEEITKVQKLEEYYRNYDTMILRNNYNYTINMQTSEDLTLWTNVRDYYEAKKYVDDCLLYEKLQTRRLDILYEYQSYYDSLSIMRRQELMTMIAEEIAYQDYREAVKALEWLSEKDHIDSLKANVSSLYAAIHELQSDIKEQANDIKIQQDHVNKSTIRYGTLMAQITHIEQNAEKRVQLQQDILTSEKRIDLLEMYDTIIGNKGMTSRMLYAKLAAVEDYINKIMTFSKYKVRISMEDGRSEMTVLVQNTETAKWLSTHRLSGYEKLLLQIAFKRALNKYSYITKCGLIILDEALDCIDQENFHGKLPDIINMITKDYYSCLAISQRDITHICDRQIIIRKVNGISFID